MRKSIHQKNYQDDKISINNRVARKNFLRIAADNSLRSGKSYIMTIASSNFIEGTIPQDHPENIKLGTDVYQELVGTMQDEFGKNVDFYPIHRSFLSRIDDTTVFIRPRKIRTPCKDNEMLVSSVHDNKTQMYYKKSCDDDDDENAKGMCLKPTFAYTGEGQVFNTYVIVSGLTEI